MSEDRLDTLEDSLAFLFEKTAKLSEYTISLGERMIKIQDRLEKLYLAYNEHFAIHSNQLDELSERIINLEKKPKY